MKYQAGKCLSNHKPIGLETDYNLKNSFHPLLLPVKIFQSNGCFSRKDVWTKSKASVEG